ncbi:hypothetical protein [Nocardia alni]|uniref:hypothetical protein n=1 Tax=Nocardia alni TaxID=2815723 RepID=UPI001C22C16D|nr:hypothetical protein [Nocardia alni]
MIDYIGTLVRRRVLRGVLAAVVALLVLAALLWLVITTSHDQDPASATMSGTPLPPITTHMVIPTVPPLREPPVEPTPAPIRIP